MSRTKTHISTGRNDRHQTDRYEYSPEYTEAFKEKQKRRGWSWPVTGPSTYYDESHTTDDSFVRPKRHPNKRKHRSLNREFAQTGWYCKMSDWRNPYGEVYDRSFRMKGARKVGRRKRRARLKEQTNREIDIQMSYTD